MSSAAAARPFRRLAVACIASTVLAAVAYAPAANAANPCPARTQVSNSTTVCAFVTNRALVFGRQPGNLTHGEISRSGTRAEAGDLGAESRTADVQWNDTAWNVFRTAYRIPVGIASYRLLGVPSLFSSEVSVKADANWFQLEGEFPRGLRCGTAGYLVCSAADVWSHTPSYTCLGIFNCIERPVQTVDAPATIETRPMIVKILNMTGQPLVRQHHPSLTGVVRDEEIADPDTVQADVDGRTGVGYYHFYRDSGHANNVHLSYAFADGAGESSLTGSGVDIDIVVDKDGSTEASSCTVPSGGIITIDCAVHVLGDADGILEAVVTVGV